MKMKKISGELNLKLISKWCHCWCHCHKDTVSNKAQAKATARIPTGPIETLSCRCCAKGRVNSCLY